MMSNREKKLLDKVKCNCYKLRKNGQLPYNLYLCVLNLNYESNKLDVITLRDLCDKYTRVGGFYIRHPEESYQCDLELKDKGYLID